MILMESGDKVVSSIVCKYFASGSYDNAEQLVEALLECSKENICYLISGLKQREIVSYSIPQYSSFKDGTINFIKYLRMAGDFGPSFLEVGQHYIESGSDERAYVKYGENHAKLAEILGVVEIRQENRKRVYLNELGKALEKRTEEEQQECFVKLSGQVPIVQYAIKHGTTDAKSLEEVMRKYLSASTAERRRRNAWDMVVMLREE